MWFLKTLQELMLIFFDELVRTSKVSFKILDCDTAGWDSDVAAILLLLHLLPPTVKGRKTGKISATEAADHVVKFMKVGTSIKAFLERVGSTQPFLLCVGGKRSSIQKFYIILDQKAIPRMVQTAVAAFDELFKAHFVFAVSYDEALCNFYTFI
ncbi:hypothetical protein ROHU_026512 [Labeo rohita]|uniref:Uncharacterized protein n=1 Tax=Labeo rohita TaxID=84645 RepID=A0A498MA33_LABRO|nr:hypothetical protein ROHU_026512 [Labeo rohita]